ncbi:hypothetical protein B0H17DRAFT_1159835 [Mycena rosella]|uniref:Uncharacterized protein n=1 Tax=Mycena rosella TaxID=1033263 RepID=A0AAD7DGT3_MYCRO|nr:hypothetical protein B0H17DRAFT_1159835 [Mycena rosella]
MFELPGIHLSSGSQRIFTRAIKALRPMPHRKSIRRFWVTRPRTQQLGCQSGQQLYSGSPTNSCGSIHNTFRVSDFWAHIDTLELNGRCHFCEAPETLEHITLELPNLSWGLILGCNLARFESNKGILIREKGRLFAIIESPAWHLIWKLRVNRVISSPGMALNEENIHKLWLKTMNAALTRDRILTNKTWFGPLSGLLMDEDSLPDDWIHEKGVLVGIRPKSNATGIG